MAFFDYHSPTPSSDFSTMLSAWQVRVQNKVSSVLRASKLRPDIGIDKYIGGVFFYYLILLVEYTKARLRRLLQGGCVDSSREWFGEPTDFNQPIFTGRERLSTKAE